MALKSACLILFVFGFANPSVLPVEKCRLSDKTCMIPAFQKMLPVFMEGITDLGVEVLDVMRIDDMKFDLSGFQFSLSEGTLKGLKNAVVDDVDWDLNKKMFNVEIHFDAVIKGHYTAGGRILILPITGDGQLKMKFKNLQLNVSTYYDLVKVGEKDHVKLTKYKDEFQVKDNAHFHLTNLFNGNKELSDTLLTFVNENWKQITVEFGRPLVNVAMDKLFKNMAIFFDKLPLEDIADL